MEYYKGIINIEASKTMTKDEIFIAVKSGLNEDFELFFVNLQKVNGTYESPSKTSKQHKKPDGK